MRSAPTIGGASPWGAIDSVTPIGDDGAAFVTTAGHGGIYLPPALAARMPPTVVTDSFLNDAQWWEEDCDWAWPVLFLGLGEPRQIVAARRWLESYKPETLAMAEGLAP